MNSLGLNSSFPIENFVCRVNGVDSRIGDLEVGVPQRSCLGPLLFLIYINDLPQAVHDSSMSMYANDTSFCYRSHELTRLSEAINSDPRKLDTWLQSNKLFLNVAKTHSMLISTKQKHNILESQNKDFVLKIHDNGLLPRCANRLLLGLERTNQGST